jgi:bifunctional DNase/RNase
MVRVDLVRILIRDSSDQQLIFLRERGGNREFPIVIGRFEADAISRKINGRVMARPMTHDLLGDMVRALEAALERVVVSKLEGGTFFAELHFRRADAPTVVDCRPSDAIALAVRTRSPIYVAKEVLNQVCSNCVTTDLD